MKQQNKVGVIMLLKNKTIEELLDMEEELHLAKEEEKDGTFALLIAVYEMLFEKVSKDKDSEYAPSLPKIKGKLISYLVQYGTYLKTVFRKDDNAAGSCLKKAVRLERNLPIAYYRLGFLDYKRKSYTTALLHFQKAIRFQHSGNSIEYGMNDQQIYNCHLYLANCGLFIAKDAQESLEKLDLNVSLEMVPSYEISPFYQLINENSQYLENHAYRIMTNKGNHYCSREECEVVWDTPNTLILDFTKRENLLIFNGKETLLTKNQGEMLRYFLINSEENPATKHDFYHLFSRADDNGEIPTNTYTQNIIRLRTKLTRLGIVEPVIENKTGIRETAYFYNHRYPYLIMHRSDEPFILSE